ncbi:MAG: ABC transporter ATP-binding protein/permease, partial [Verrucomicrobia bacterium]|nr:ABC transporter ATP-binding protein/permease [Verrucomicrobiota bacterium]
TIAYLRESDTQRRFSESVGEAYSRRLAQHRAEVAYLLVVGVVFGLGTAVIAWLGVFEVKRGELSLGGLIVFVSYLSQLYEPLNRLSHLGTTVTGARAGVRRVFEILDTADEPVEGRAARGIALTQRDVKEGQRRRPLIFKGDIGFRNAGFGYNPGSRVLRDISFDVDSGDSVAVVGHNGAGKTTLLQMIPRFFDPDAGAVLFDGEDITGLKLADVRRVVAFAFQTPFVFPGTVAENIALGKPGALMDEIIEAAASAHAEDVIEKLPAGYDTVIGEAGVQFSAGEKQRLNLARLFLKDAPVLVIDEPVSALDAESAECVRAALKKLMPGRTVFLAAHDPVTVALARKVLVLNEGEMTYFGENTGSSIGLE